MSPDRQYLAEPRPESVKVEAKGANSWTGFTNGEIFGGFERPIENAIRAYMATVTSLDREIGKLDEEVEESEVKLLRYDEELAVIRRVYLGQLKSRNS